MALNPKRSRAFAGNRPRFALRAHATLRLHGEGKNQRLEIGFRIPVEMEKRLFELLGQKSKGQS